MKKLFTNDIFFLVMTLLGFFGLLSSGIYCIITYPEHVVPVLSYVIIAFCLFFLRSSYLTHNKNVMKGLMGSLLMAGLLNIISLLDMIILPIDKVFTPIALVLFMILFVSHYLINSDRHSNPRLIALNQLLCVLLAVIFLVWDIIWACICGDPLTAVMSIVLALGTIGLYASIVCVESRLDAYRLDREAAGWTEGKGYPEGYVHEYEKK